jgi:murein endopeptidase
MRRAVLGLLMLALAAPAGAQLAPPEAEAPEPAMPHSVALGRPWHGRLQHGVQLPVAGPDWITWDPVLHQSPNRDWRLWGTDALVLLLERVAREYREAHPDVAPLLIADLSRPQGGVFDKRFGGLGHASHQNGLDADVMYPRVDRLPRAARRPAQVDRLLAQELVDRFLAAGAVKLFVGYRVGLRGPRRVVVAIPHHEDHVHVRIANPRR